MDTHELESEKKINIEKLNSILNAYQNAERKYKKILIFIVVVCAIAIYYMFFDLLGGIWGYVLTVAILGAIAFCVGELGIAFKNNSVSDGKLAYHACVTMEILIAIKEGTYRQYGTHILTTDLGEHHNLYKQFVLMYPEYANKHLEKISKIKVAYKDIYN